MPFMGPDPRAWSERGGHPHVGSFLRRQRTYAQVGAEQLAQADGSWGADDVILVEQRHIIDADDWLRYRRALELAIKYLREDQR